MEGVIESVEPFGKFQKYTIFLVGLSSILISMLQYSTVFTMAEPSFTCHSRSKNQTFLDNCQIWYNLTSSTTNESLYECNFDTTYYGKTAVNEWGLVCDKKYLASLIQTLYLVGTVSSLVLGPISDIYGRKFLSVGLMFALFITLITVELSQSKFLMLNLNVRYFIYCVAQFLIGLFANAIYSTLCMLLLEMTTSKYSTIANNCNLYMFVFGEVVILVLAYFLRDWHLINWVLAFYTMLIAITLVIFLSESPKYLVNRKKYRKAFLVLKKIWEQNGKKCSNKRIEDKMTIEELLKRDDSDFKLKNSSIAQKFDIITNETNSLEISENHGGILQFIFKSSQNCMQTILHTLVWFAATLAYFGITTVGNVNPYLMFLLGSIAEFLGFFLTTLNDKFGRKKMLALYFGLAGATCLSIAFIPREHKLLLLIFASFGKMMVSALMGTCYVFTGLSLPTEIRGTLFLLISSLGRVGSVISPFINLLGDLIWKPLPYFIFSSSAFLASVFVLILPDPSTLGYS